MSGIWYDLDSTDAFFNAPLGKMDSGYLDLVVDSVSGGQVIKYFVCPGADASIFRGKHWSLYAEGFDLNKGSEQECMCGEKSEWLYRFAHNLHSLLAQGVDPVEYTLKRVKHENMEAWISMRMNDIHCGEEPHAPLHCPFWKEHPELRISDVPYENSLDYSYGEARAFVLNRALELIERFDMDGFQMDWTRFPTFFPHGEGGEKSGLITEMIKRIKQEAVKRKIPTGARVPGIIDICKKRGLDVVEWAKEGLIDHIVIAPFLMTSDFDMPVEEWQNAIGHADIKIAYGMEGTASAYPGAPRKQMTPEEIRACASIAFNKGADAVYLFNYFQEMQSAYPEIFKQIGSLETMSGKSKTFRITWHDNRMTIGEQDKMNRFLGWIEKWRKENIESGTYPFSLPALIPPSGTKAFTIDTGPKPEPKSICILEISFREEKEGGMIVKFNDKALVREGESFKVSTESIKAGHNSIIITNNEDVPLEVHDVQLKMRFT